MLAVALVLYLALHGQNPFRRRYIREIQQLINSFGVFSPLAVILLILLSTAVPPLPLPVPIIEIAAGLAFGFWTGFLLIWFSQITSSLFAFQLTRFFGKRVFGKVLNSKIWHLYSQYIDRRGPLAVFLIRLMMAAPFKIISFVAGVTKMKTGSFIFATALGTIPEAVLFTLLGAQLRNIHLRLWYLFIFLVVLSVTGPLITFLAMRFMRLNKE